MRMSLVLENVNGNYEPSNCQWLTRSENTKRLGGTEEMQSDREKLIALLRGCRETADKNAVPRCSEEYCKENREECFGDLIHLLLANGLVVREKGEWEIRVDDYDNELMWCPFCHEEFYDGENDTVDHTPNFCPNCGADMRGAVNDG